MKSGIRSKVRMDCAVHGSHVLDAMLSRTCRKAKRQGNELPEGYQCYGGRCNFWDSTILSCVQNERQIGGDGTTKIRASPPKLGL